MISFLVWRLLIKGKMILVQVRNFGGLFVAFHDNWFYGRDGHDNLLATVKGGFRIEPFYQQNRRHFCDACNHQE